MMQRRTRVGICVEGEKLGRPDSKVGFKKESRQGNPVGHKTSRDLERNKKEISGESTRRHR